MNKAISLALLAVGIVLIIWGVSASESFGSDVSRFKGKLKPVNQEKNRNEIRSHFRSRHICRDFGHYTI